MAYKRRVHDIEHFVSPVLAGLASTACLAVFDAVMPLTEGTSRAMGFVAASIKHIHIELVLVGLLLLSLCYVLIGSPIARLIRRVVVLPLVQLAHHVFLIGAGVMIALLVTALFRGESAATLTMLVTGVAFLLLGGAEMQAAESVCRLSDEELGRHLPVFAIIVLALLATGVFTWLLVANIGAAH